MTTFRQEEYESFLLEGKKVVTEMKVTNDTLNHPDMMTEAEMENATAVFRLELSVKSFTDPYRCLLVINFFYKHPNFTS